MKKATREWVRKAEADYQLAAKLDREREPFYDHRCFLCQQSSEKYLKALLEERAIPVAKTHDLEGLLNVLLSHHPRLRSLRRGLRFLTDFAVEPRYPGEWKTKRQALSALRWASKVRDACLLILAIRPSRRRRRTP
jgi:HEPN domain-containing protein